MPRRSSGGGRSASRPSRSTTKNPPAPAKPSPAPATVTSGGSVFGSLRGAITDGIGWGVGTSIGHRAVDAVMGPRVIQHENVSSEPEAAAAAAAAQPNPSVGPDACNIHSKAFGDCINTYGSDISKCQFYLDMLNECRRNASNTLQA